MGIAALTATSLARPLHTLQRWWQQLHPVSALCADGAQGAAQPDPCAVSVAILRRARSTATAAVGNWHAATDSMPITGSTLALPAFRRLNHRELPRHNSGATHPDLLRLNPLPCPMPALRVLHRPANLARPGGLVIAGRMADVCAELDRLVAMEAVH